jgi:hypothetical protein
MDAEPDGVELEPLPWRARSDLEAEIEWLRGFCRHQTNEVVRLLMAEAQLGRPRSDRPPSKRHARRQRAEPPCSFREMLRGAGKPHLWDLMTGEHRPLTKDEARESQRDWLAGQENAKKKRT